MKIITDLEDGGFIIHSTNKEWITLCSRLGLYNSVSEHHPTEIDIMKADKAMKHLRQSVLYLKGVIGELEGLSDAKD